MPAAGTNALFGRLLRYPGRDFALGLAAIPARLEEESSEAARLVREFGDRIGRLTLEELQELYTRTFELNPVCALEVGWQHYGEEYARGSFLVFLRDALRQHGIPEETELPDHLIHVLPLLDRLSNGEANELVEYAVLPAIEKMVGGLAGKNNPYESLLRAIVTLLGTRSPREPAEVSHA